MSDNLEESIEKYCPSNCPILIPYMEVYRTDEMSYVDYESPMNKANSSSTSSSSNENTTTTTDGDAENSDGTSASSSSSSSKSKSSSSSKTTTNTKGQKLYTALATEIPKYFKSGVNVNTLVNRYRNCGGKLFCVYKITVKSKVWLKSGYKPEKVANIIYRKIKEVQG